MYSEYKKIWCVLRKIQKHSNLVCKKLRITKTEKLMDLMDYVFILRNYILKHKINLKHLNFSESLHILYKIKFTRYLFFSCKNSCIQSKKFSSVKKWNYFKKAKEKTLTFGVWKIKNYNNTKF